MFTKVAFNRFQVLLKLQANKKEIHRIFVSFQDCLMSILSVLDVSTIRQLMCLDSRWHTTMVGFLVNSFELGLIVTPRSLKAGNRLKIIYELLK